MACGHSPGNGGRRHLRFGQGGGRRIDEKSRQYSEAKRFLAVGMVIDCETLETGSFNYSSSAEYKNAENVLVLHDAAVARRYAQEWQRLWDESEEPQ